MLIQSHLKEILNYDPSSGEITNKKLRSIRSAIGEIAGTINQDGYRRIKIEGASYMAHRLVWLYVYGEWPISQIDHINGLPDDNRLSNLRPATNSENRQNLRGAQKNNRCGFLGVSKNWNNWKATIRINGKRIGLGTYKTPEQAHSAYMEAKRKIHHACTI